MNNEIDELAVEKLKYSSWINLDEVYIKVDIFIDTVSLEGFELPENSLFENGLLIIVLLMASNW